MLKSESQMKYFRIDHAALTILMSRNQKEDTIDHEEHIELATFIKGVHAELRNKYKNS